MIRELPPDWAPAWPPPPQTRFQRLVSASFDRCPWDQIAIAAFFALYLLAMCALTLHLAA